MHLTIVRVPPVPSVTMADCKEVMFISYLRKA